MGRRKADIDIEKAEELASHGLTDKAIARALGVSAKTIQRRKGDMSALSASLARARAKMEAWAADKLVQMMDDPNIPPKVRLTAICWYLERRCGWTLNQIERRLEAENTTSTVPSITVQVQDFRLGNKPMSMEESAKKIEELTAKGVLDSEGYPCQTAIECNVEGDGKQAEAPPA